MEIEPYVHSRQCSLSRNGKIRIEIIIIHLHCERRESLLSVSFYQNSLKIEIGRGNFCFLWAYFCRRSVGRYVCHGEREERGILTIKIGHLISMIVVVVAVSHTKEISLSAKVCRI
jgi:hypothetical protein